MSMASITIRNIDEETKRRLKIRAAQRNRSMEEEVRNILCAALAEGEPQVHLVDSIRSRFESVGVDLLIPAREAIRQPPDFGA
jgi:antitoxin FitA